MVITFYICTKTLITSLVLCGIKILRPLSFVFWLHTIGTFPMNTSMLYTASSGSWIPTMIFWSIKRTLSDMVTTHLPIELLIEYFHRFVLVRWLIYFFIVMPFGEANFILVNVSSLSFFISLRFQESLLARLKARWDMKILSTSYCQKRIKHLSLVLSIGISAALSLLSHLYWDNFMWK